LIYFNKSEAIYKIASEWELISKFIMMVLKQITNILIISCKNWAPNNVEKVFSEQNKMLLIISLLCNVNIHYTRIMWNQKRKKTKKSIKISWSLILISNGCSPWRQSNKNGKLWNNNSFHQTVIPVLSIILFQTIA